MRTIRSKRKRQRILLLKTLSGTVGGAESVFADLVSLLRQRRINLYTVSNGITFKRHDLDYVVPMTRPRAKRGIVTASSMLEMLSSSIWFFCMCLRVRPTLINVHFVDSAALYTFLFQSLFRYRIVLTVHGGDVIPSQYRGEHFPDKFLRWALCRADAVTAVSRSLANATQSIAPRMKCPPILTPNGIDLNYWSATTSTRDPMRMLSVGALKHVKGHDILLRALTAVVRQFPAVRLMLAGNGPARHDLQGLAQDLGLSRHVVFLGELSSDQIRKQLGRASLFVMPSRSEGLSLATIEALSSGVTVVATSVGGMPEIISDGCTGFLVQPEDPNALAERLIACLRSPHLCRQVGACGAQSTHSYSLEHMVDSYVNAYDLVQRAND